MSNEIVENGRELAVDRAHNPFGSVQFANQQATAMVAVEQSRAVAELQAAMMVAQKVGRNPKLAMDNILNACMRPTLAEKATYMYARSGTDITGPSIRLAEVLAQGWGHIKTSLRELEQRDGWSTVQAIAWDLVSGYQAEKVFQVRHWRDTKKGGYAITDSRDIYEISANQGARRLRACILAVIPGDVVEAALDQCERTLNSKAEVTPERLQSLIEKFAAFGVLKEHIEARIQRRLEAMMPAQLLSLGKIYNSLSDAMSVPRDWFELEPTVVSAAKLTTGATALKEAATKRAAAKSTAKDKAAAPADDSADLDTQQEAGLDAATKKGDSKSGGGGALKVTVAQVGDAIRVAKSADALDQAKDLIRYVPDEFHKDLLAQADAKFEEISPKGA